MNVKRLSELVVGQTGKVISVEGDLYIKILVQIPTKLSSSQRNALEAFSKLEGATDSPQLVPLTSME